MAGDFNTAKQTCRKFCVSHNLCVNIFETDYIYRCGEEIGFCVEIINYPKYVEDDNVLENNANLLAKELMVDCSQKSYTIMLKDKTKYCSREDEFER
jgi:hypothetical protein